MIDHPISRSWPAFLCEYNVTVGRQAVRGDDIGQGDRDASRAAAGNLRNGDRRVGDRSQEDITLPDTNFIDCSIKSPRVEAAPDFESLSPIGDGAILLPVERSIDVHFGRGTIIGHGDVTPSFLRQQRGRKQGNSSSALCRPELELRFQMVRWGRAVPIVDSEAEPARISYLVRRQRIDRA